MESGSTVKKSSSNKGFNQYKIVLLGQTGVGKTNLVLRYVDGEFVDGNKSTIGAALTTKLVTITEGGVPTKLEIWDTAGQERFAALAPLYYRGAQAAIIVYDVTDAGTFKKAKEWVEELKTKGPEGITIGLAGNKVDLDSIRQVPTKEAEEYAKEEGFVFMETSAKTGDKVAELFVALVGEIPTGDLMGVTPNRNNLAPPVAPKGSCCSRT